MKKIILTILAALLCSSAFAQNKISVYDAEGTEVFSFIENTADPVMRQLSSNITSKRQSNPSEFVTLLAGFINEKASSDYDRIKKAHDWVTLNIRYDTQSFFSGRYSSQEANDVIKRGSAVCQGYSDVFKMICDALQIECIVVTGFARGYGSNLFSYEDTSDSNHAWNIVIIDGKSFLIDSTWNAGYVNGRNFQARYETDYLFADPSVFIYNHFPIVSAYQLINPPVSAQDFTNLPHLKPRFFQAINSWTELPRISEVNQNDEIEMEFTVNSGYDFAYHIYTQSGRQINRIFPSRMKVYKVKLPKLEPGKYFLRIYIKKQGENQYWSCGEFGFNVKS
ncbi:MAG: hypothetical protein FWC12_08115 [Treponema sp.]|nr:hypothetical protein [Treponema sp.]